jgi:hypothetical protein
MKSETVLLIVGILALVLAIATVFRPFQKEAFYDDTSSCASIAQGQQDVQAQLDAANKVMSEAKGKVTTIKSALADLNNLSTSVGCS